jgi:ribosomal-protein-alanine N-acetyltransferase
MKIIYVLFKKNFNRIKHRQLFYSAQCFSEGYYYYEWRLKESQKMKFELLTNHYLSQLITFEYENRDWFESFIESRGDSFYGQKSIKKHLIDSVNEYTLGQKYPAVVVNEHHIMGRANLKNICLKSKTAEVGYRVAECYSGTGVASYSLKELIKVSKEKLALKSLNAIVLDNNPASARVLEKKGFEQVETISNFYNFLGDELSGTKYQLKLS